MASVRPEGLRPQLALSPQRAAVVRAQGRLVTIHTIPKRVDIFVDGMPVGPYTGQAIRVGPGGHDLTFTSDCCAAAKVRLGPSDIANDLVRLPWKAARVLVETRPAEASILYTTARRPGQSVARGGQAIPIPIPVESETGEVEVHLRVSAPGYQSRELEVKARAGQTFRESIELGRLP